MILYHGSLKPIEKPDISYSRDSTDFGKGFYTTTIKSQAEKWTNRFRRRFGYGALSVYEIDIEQDEAIRRLRHEKPNIQYCFKNQETIDKYLKFIGTEPL